MENTPIRDSYIASLEQRMAALTAERDSLQQEATVLSEALQGLQASAEKQSAKCRREDAR